MNKIILGIDPGLATTGFSVLEISGQTTLLKDFGVFLTQKTDSTAERLFQIGKDFEEILKKWNPDILAIEKLVFVKNVTNGLLVAEARGVVLEKAFAHGLKICEFLPTAVKSGVTGNGHASKNQMQKMVQVIFHLPEIPKPDDAADAIAVALCAGRQ